MSVRVVARIRPLLKQELDKDTIVTAEGSEADATPTVVRIPNPKNDAESFSFQFNSVYEQEATQQQLFESEVSPTVKHLFKGQDVCIFAYGVTGTGKTHTMRGGKSLADRGVIPRLLSNIYRKCRKIEKDSGGATSVEVSMSYYEIYCDRVYDLFEPPEKRTPSGLPIRDNGGKTVVVGLTERPCSTLKEFEQLYDQANVNRSTSSTKLNAHSSRSHAILCVKVTQTTESTVLVSRASAIDLAGSEDNRRTDNNRERLVESSAINKSLFVLAQCVEAISKKQSRIPYRESKMTRILSLGQNNGLTVMILNLAPVRSYHLDTLSSLNFANRTKKIEIAEVENEPMYRNLVKPLATSSIGGANIARQPLRPLNAATNVNLNNVVEKKKPAEKPPKAFTVYADRKPGARMSNLTAQNQSVRRTGATNKRPADACSTFGTRPTKAVRSDGSVYRSNESALSQASIEALISRTIDEKLAEKALQDSGAPTAALSAELQKRLDDLENRIEAKEDDSRGPGLQFLLMAKQHLAHGEEPSALRMFQMALPYFPDNAKLVAKIKKLEASMKAKRDLESLPHASPRPAARPQASSLALLPVSGRMGPLKSEQQSTLKWEENDELGHLPPPRSIVPLKTEKKHSKVDTWSEEGMEDEDEDFAPAVESDADDSYLSETSKPKVARKPKKSTRKLPIYRDTDHVAVESIGQTPRTRHLLNIINSKDVSQIRALKGVGVKKADAIVSSLLDLDDDEVQDLNKLANIKGIGGRMVENMRMGICIDFDF